MDWEEYLKNYQPKYMERIYHGSPYFETTNGEYIFKPQKPVTELDKSPWLGGEGYATRDMSYAQIFANTGDERGLSNLTKKIIGVDIDPDRFFDIGKNLNEQPEYIQRAVAEASRRNPDIYNSLLIDAQGNLKPLPKLMSPQWNIAMDALHPYGVQGLHDSINKADADTFVFRYAKDMPKGVNLGAEGNEILGVNNLQIPARNINKQTTIPQPKQQVEVPVKVTPKVTNVPLGARLYDAKLNPKELAKIATDPEVLSNGMKTIEKIMRDPRAYLNVGKGLVKGILAPENVALMASDYLVHKASQGVNKRLENKYDIKSQAEFNRLYPTLSAQERGQLGYTYPEMYQTYMKGR